MAEAVEKEAILQFSGVYHVVRGDRKEGSVKINSKGLAFKAKTTGNISTFNVCSSLFGKTVIHLNFAHNTLESLNKAHNSHTC